MSLDTFIAEAERWIGYTEGITTPFGEWYDKKTKQTGFASAAWCDMFLGYCAEKAGVLNAVGLYAYTPYHVEFFKDQNRWHNGTVGIRRGDIVFYDWDGGVVDHVGVVTSVKGADIYTIEGNTSNAVLRRKRGARYIKGYGRPDYSKQNPRPQDPKEEKPDVPIPSPPLVLDGEPGPKTWKAIQRVLNYRDGSGLEIDGVPGPLTIRALQRALNRGKL